MANGTLKVENIQTSSGSGTITLGQSGETVVFGSGVTTKFNQPAWSVYLSSNQSVPNTTATKINFDSINFDSDSVYDNSTDYEVTIPTGKGGKYWMYIRLWIDNIDGSDEVATARLYKNGSLLSDPTFLAGMNGSGTTGDGGKVYINVSGLVTASDGDTFSVYCYHNSGATENARGGNCSFHGYRLGVE